MRPLKPATEPSAELSYRPRRLIREETGRWLGATPLVIGGVELIWNSFWFVLTLPFRLVFGIFSLVGRLAALVVGFVIMVGGAALLPGPFALIGLALFAIGLLLALRSLE